jgi:hypothetical protein
MSVRNLKAKCLISFGHSSLLHRISPLSVTKFRILNCNWIAGVMQRGLLSGRAYTTQGRVATGIKLLNYILPLYFMKLEA